MSIFYAIYLIAVVLIAVTAIYCLMITRNLIRILIGLEILIKAVTLLLIAIGHIGGNLPYAESFVITLIIVEVVIMATAAGIVIGGQTRNIGKTSVVAGLIAALRERQWTAVKITQYGHGICSADGVPCDCATADHSWVIGDFVWTAFDYFGESGIGHTWLSNEKDSFLKPYPWFNAWCGDIDVCGFKKPQSYYRDVVWRRSQIELMVHTPIPAGVYERVSGWGWPDETRSWNWPGQEGKPLQVAVYSRCDSVRLELNGKVIGEKPVSAATKLMAKFDVPYEPGTLTAACAGSDTRASLVTAGPPARLSLTADRPRVRADRNDLSFVRIEVVDAKGRVVPTARPAVRARVTGPGELSALASADPVDISGFRGPSRRPYQGVLQAIVRPRAAGTIELVAEADGLAPARLAITAR